MHETLRAIQRQPERAGLFLDFDGTLSEIVPVPADARPLEGVPELLEMLSSRYAVVAVVSGRSAEQLLRWLGTDVEIWGTHGAEHTAGGEIEIAAEVIPYLDEMREVRAEAERRLRELGIDGSEIEDKRAVLSLHYRRSPDRSAARDTLLDLARSLAEGRGFVVREGRLVVEIRPPVDVSKALVVMRRAQEEDLRAIAFFGDDAVDLPAFDALDGLDERGLATARVAVSSDEAPRELIKRADVVVEGPPGVVQLLRELL
jgi:trehalose 6-phosphate phosphatase